MGGDPLALGENLHGPRGEPDLDLLLREAVGHAVIMPVDIDVIIDADAANAPFGEHIRLDRQRFEWGPVEFFEQLAPRHAEPADRPFIVDPDQQFTDRPVQLRQAVETLVAQAAENPALHDQHAGLHLRLVAWFARPCRQDGGAVMRRHLGIGPVDRRLVEAGFDHGRLGIVGHDQLRHAADRLESPRVGADPVRQPLRPGRLGIGEVGRAEHGDEDPGLPVSPVSRSITTVALSPA